MTRSPLVGLRNWVKKPDTLTDGGPKKIRLSADHLRRREEFCSEVEHKSALEWEVVFTDSTYVYRNHQPISQNDGAWCTEGEQPHPQSYFRHGESFHVYGGITPFVLIGPIFVEKITARKYLPVLKKLCQQAAAIFAANGYPDATTAFVLQQDGASAHTSELVQNWIAEQELYDIWDKSAWPPSSPLWLQCRCICRGAMTC